jgi:flavin-dependent dehydrogenase
MKLQNHYDVIIVGAGIAGQNCAKNLINTDLSVLLVESNPNFQNKSCAGGLTDKDKKYISPKYYKEKTQKGCVVWKNEKILTNRPVITPISRSKYLEEGIKEISKSSNIQVLIPNKVINVNDKYIEIENGQKISFDYLVGADGTFSIVRKYLGLKKKRLWIGMQYSTLNSGKKDVSEIHLEKDTTGYYWIFPRGSYCSVGIWTLLEGTPPNKAKGKLDKFLIQNKLTKKANTLSSAVVNSAYRGYKFGNIYLAGDAAGLTPGLTGEGIYPALLSGRVIAQSILQKKKDSKEIIKHLLNKYTMDMFANLLNKRLSRKIFFSVGIKMFKNTFLQRIILKVASS